jgi:chromosome segregation ATPase
MGMAVVAVSDVTERKSAWKQFWAWAFTGRDKYVKALEAKVERLEAQNGALNENRATLVAAYAARGGALAEAEGRIETLLANVAEFQLERRDLIAEKAAEHARASRIQDVSIRRLDQLDEFREENKRLKAENADLAKTVEGLGFDLRDMRAQLDAVVGQ